MEIWKPIKGYEGLYEISNYGRVKSLARTWVTGHNSIVRSKDESILAPKKDRGYLRVGLLKNGKRKLLSIHRLVAEHFIPNPLNKPEVNHRDGNKENNHFSNLEWVTPAENTQHAESLRLRKHRKGSECHNAKLTEEQVLEIRNLYSSGKFTQEELAKRFNVYPTAIQKIVNRKNWKHLA